MSETKHTPGPWLNWETLEWLHEPQRLLTSPANARLMGAAPDILGAAKAAVEQLSRASTELETEDPKQFHGRVAEALFVLRGAIAEAEGRS